MVNSKDFSKRLKKILEFYGISATTFADEIDFNRSTISHLLSGRNKPSLEFVMKVLQKFPEVELYWLLNGKGSFPAQENIESQNPYASAEYKNDLFQTSNTGLPPQKDFPNEKTSQNSSEIERVLIFFKNGSFIEYKN